MMYDVTRQGVCKKYAGSLLFCEKNTALNEILIGFFLKRRMLMVMELIISFAEGFIITPVLGGSIKAGTWLVDTARKFFRK